MKLVLERLQLDADVTIGSLSIDGVWQCWTLEDVVRPATAPKVPGKTAIPFGTYALAITPSARFGRDMPLLVNVPNFSGVRIHWGNTAVDTDGCILVGQDRMARSIGRSRAAFAALFPLLRDGVAKGPSTIQIVRP